MSTVFLPCPHKAARAGVSSDAPAFFVSAARQAGKGHKMKVKQSNTKSKQYQIPMAITGELIRDSGINPESVTWRHIGNRKCRVVLVDVTKDEYKAHMEPIWVGIKRENRDGHHIVKGKNGNLIHYLETGHFGECKHFSVVRQNGNGILKRNKIFRRIIKHMEKYGWFYGAVMQLIGTAVLEIIVI